MNDKDAKCVYCEHEDWAHFKGDSHRIAYCSLCPDAGVHSFTSKGGGSMNPALKEDILRRLTEVREQTHTAYLKSEDDRVDENLTYVLDLIDELKAVVEEEEL